MMFHFRGNPTCSTRASDSGSIVSAAPDLATFRDCHSGKYCAECAGIRSDSDRYAELRRLVEAVQIDSKLGTARAALDALLDWRHR